MMYRLFPFTVLMLASLFVSSQNPQNISLEKQLATGLEKFFACPDQNAGTISFANFSGQSNDLDPDTIFLCRGDNFNVVHNGDADLTGDPNPATTPGVTYIWYDCPPTVNGPNLTGVLTDGCIFLGPPPPINGFYVTAGGNPNGNQTFNNTGTLQTTFNGGAPLLLWFAPITVDNFSLKQYEVDPVTGEVGPCVNVNTSEAFAVVYLNQIQINNLNTNAGMSGCRGQFQLIGGLPEYDGSAYTISITLQGNPSVMGTVTNNNPVLHNGTVNFEVPAPGIYEITIEDGKSCGATTLANMSGCVNMTQSIGSTVAAPGANICLEVTSEDGFDAIASMQYAINFEGSVIQYTGVQNFTPLLPNFNQNNFSFLNDTLRLTWFQGVGGTTIPDGTVLFELCFQVVGPDGACTDLSFVEIGPITDIEIVNANGNELGFNGIPGLVCVSSAALQVNATGAPTSCFGSIDGSFTVTVSGGTAPYNVSWNNTMGGPGGGSAVINLDGGSFTATNLPAGTYMITIVDNSPTPLTTFAEVTVDSPPMLNLLFSTVLGDCAGDPGSILSNVVLDSTIVVNPLANGFTFLWSNGAATTSINNVNPGNYTLTVTQTATGCVVQGAVFLPQTPSLDVTVQVTPATCTGIPDGVISISVTGGTPNPLGNYSIVLGSTSVNNTQSSLMAQAGEYDLLVTDNNGCTFEQTVVLPAVKVLSIAPNITNVSCNSDCDGSILATGLTDGGVPGLPYSFAWTGTPTPPPAINTPNNSTLNNLCIGTYTVVMTDIDGCTVDSTFTIIQPSPLDLTLVSVTDESCQPGMDGTITVAVSGGAFPYTYNWNNPSTDSTATGLEAGLYTLVVTDSEGCFAEIQAQVNVPAPPVIQTLNNNAVDCSSSTNGTLTVVPTNPANIIQYAWSNGQVGPTISNLAPGPYTVTITDANLCTAEGTAMVTSPLPLTLGNVSLQSPSCVGGNNGQIIVTVNGGTPGYTYGWSTPGAPNGPVFAFAQAGPHTVIVTDANGCPPLIVEVVLDPPPAIQAVFSNVDSVSCATIGTVCDGTATVFANYSDGSNGSFSFIWINSNETSNNTSVSTATQLCQGDQPVIVADQFCADTFLVNIPAPLPIVPGQNIENVSCNGGSDGRITLLPIGGTPPYSIVWGNGTVGPVLANLPVGNYTAVITDSKNCTFTHTVTVIEPDPFVLNLDNTLTQNVSCAGEMDGIVSVFAQGGNPPASAITYLWQNNVGPLDSRTSNPLAAGTYTVTAIDSKGCEATLTHTVTAPPPIMFEVGDIPTINCFGGNTSISVDTAWGGTGLLRFRVNNGPLVSIGQFASGFLAGDHVITVQDVNNCSASQTITINQPIEIVVELPNIVEIDLGDSLTFLDPVIISSVPIDSFIWSPANQLSCTNCKNPRVNAVDDQQYQLIVIDINGCTGTASVLVDIDRNRNVYIPNVFSPNGDGLNDDFKVFTGPGVVAINFVRIYNRWGDLVHSVDDPVPSIDGTAAWDGSFRGDVMNPAVFLYLIEVVFLDGRVLLYRGDIALVR